MLAIIIIIEKDWCSRVSSMWTCTISNSYILGYELMYEHCQVDQTSYKPAISASSFFPIHFNCFTGITRVLFVHNIPLIVPLLFKPKAQAGKRPPPLTPTHLKINKQGIFEMIPLTLRYFNIVMENHHLFQVNE